MTPTQMEQMMRLMQSLNDIQQRMARVKNLFPNHYAHLNQRYNQLLVQAREQRMLPPWMK